MTKLHFTNDVELITSLEIGVGYILNYVM